jgi:hypothetical protein
MFLRPGAKAALVVLALAVLAFAPVVAADHAYSHRYIVFGRVVDAENNPVPGLTMDLGYEEPFEPEGACANQPGTETEAFGPTRTTPVTNQYGEFVFCFHTHSMSRTVPGTGILTIDTLEVEKRFEFDGFMRYSWVPIKLETAQSTANKTILDTSYTVQGRAWRASGGPISVETVRVYGDTVQRTPVTVDIEYNDGKTATVNTTTNGYGDFWVRVPVTERANTGRVTITIENATFTEDVDPSGVTAFRAEMPKTRDPFVTKFLIGLGIVAGVVVVGGGAWFATNRMRASREEREARDRSQRKRANK